tara:strand:- start:47 stop:730 length:684 start_codon:yes stop_codon:yes gene_type:complete
MNTIISYHELVGIEKQNLQRGMNYRCSKTHSVFLMSTRKNAPYNDEIAADGRILIYEGHDSDKRYSKNPKTDDQPRFLPSGKLTDNGKFEKAAIDFKTNKRDPETVRVYEKIKDGIWSFNGVFKLVDAYEKQVNDRKVFKFILQLTDEKIKGLKEVIELEEDARVIPSEVKAKVWKRDKGQCVKCGSKEHLHFDHILPYSKGGTSRDERNIQLLCARHNLQKSDKII